MMRIMGKITKRLLEKFGAAGVDGTGWHPGRPADALEPRKGKPLKKGVDGHGLGRGPRRKA